MGVPRTAVRQLGLYAAYALATAGPRGPGLLRGATIAPATSTRTWACGSTTCSREVRLGSDISLDLFRHKLSYRNFGNSLPWKRVFWS